MVNNWESKTAVIIFSPDKTIQSITHSKQLQQLAFPLCCSAFMPGRGLLYSLSVRIHWNQADAFSRLSLNSITAYFHRFEVCSPLTGFPLVSVCRVVYWAAVSGFYWQWMTAVTDPWFCICKREVWCYFKKEEDSYGVSWSWEGIDTNTFYYIKPKD